MKPFLTPDQVEMSVEGQGQKWKKTKQEESVLGKEVQCSCWRNVLSVIM